MSQNKPLPKREVAVHYFDKKGFIIDFYATKDAVDEFKEFGFVQEMPDRKNGFSLFVDKRYDFDEVLAYIENYG